VRATSGGLSDSLPLTIRVAETVAGAVSLTSDFPELRGPSTTNFSFTVTIHNDTPAETTFAMDAVGPAGWTVAAKPTGEAQATSTTVKAGGTAALSVTAQAPDTVAADTYPIAVTVTGGGESASIDLAVVVTGTYTMTVSTRTRCCPRPPTPAAPGVPAHDHQHRHWLDHRRQAVREHADQLGGALRPRRSPPSSRAPPRP
jgi:uncharacterized membrane protein